MQLWAVNPMFLLYSLLFSIAFVIMLPVFYLQRAKYADGFWQRLGGYPEFKHDGREVIWLHCVSVGETNAARPLVDSLLAAFPGRRLVVSTTTKTGQQLAKDVFAGKADAVFYFPLDFKFAVEKALNNYKPSAVLLMETEIWPRFYREADKFGAKLVIVNGRLSKKSYDSYSLFSSFVGSVLGRVDLALMQAENDAVRIGSLGVAAERIQTTGNMKFDLAADEKETSLTEELRERFGIDPQRPLIVAASTHEPEEERVLEAFAELLVDSKLPRPRLLIAPRHPERFGRVTELVRNFAKSGETHLKPLSLARRSEAESENDKSADVILLDTIGELRAVYPLADIVFVGGSLIPHGGQSVLEPAAAGKAIVTGPFTHNFEAVVKTFAGHSALIQLPERETAEQTVDELFLAFSDLLEEADKRNELGRNAASVMKANRGATAKTVEALRDLLSE